MIQEEEVLNYVLERYEEYRGLIKETLGQDVPWVIDNRDITRTIQVAIVTFRRELSLAGYRAGTDQYNELLAVALYAFALAPTAEHATALPLPQEVIAELADARLEKILDSIRSKGGLGLLEIKDDCRIEATATKALEEKCGGCTEQSYVVYAVFKMAGLHAASVGGKPSTEAMTTYGWNPAAAFHASVGLILEKKERVFDAGLKLSDAAAFYEDHFDWWLMRSNRESLAVYYSNLGDSSARHGDTTTSIAQYLISTQLDHNAETYYNLGFIYETRGELNNAIAAYKTALQADPAHAVAYSRLGVAYGKQGELEKAITEFEAAIAVHPKFSDAHSDLGRACTLMAEKLEREPGKSERTIAFHKRALAAFKAASRFDRPANVGIINEVEKTSPDVHIP